MSFTGKLSDVFQYFFDRTRVKAQEMAPIITNAAWHRPSSFCDLPDDQLRYIHDASKCPYCKSKYGLWEGPRGGASVNMFCGNPDCNSRFNVVGPEFGFIPMGQFTGECPKDFLDMRRAQILVEKDGL